MHASVSAEPQPVPAAVHQTAAAAFPSMAGGEPGHGPIPRQGRVATCASRGTRRSECCCAMCSAVASASDSASWAIKDADRASKLPERPASEATSLSRSNLQCKPAQSRLLWQSNRALVQ